jgi:hypothetical protein
LSINACANWRPTSSFVKADLLIVERRGRERWNHLNAVPIHRIHARWIGPLAAGAAGLLDNLKRDLETGQ